MKNKIYLLGKGLGLNKKDINKIITSSNKKIEQVNFSRGPYYHHGGRYGTISVNQLDI